MVYIQAHWFIVQGSIHTSPLTGCTRWHTCKHTDFLYKVVNTRTLTGYKRCYSCKQCLAAQVGTHTSSVTGGARWYTDKPNYCLHKVVYIQAH